MKKIIGILGTATLGAIIALGLNHLINGRQFQTVFAEPPQPIKYVNLSGSDAQSMIDFTGAAEMSVHSVVHVKTTYPVQNYQDGPFYSYDPFRDLFGGQIPQQSIPQMASGSGVIISSDGYIVTNNHVIDKADHIEVILNDKRTYDAELVGKDPTTDIALLKIKEQNLPYLSYGNSDDIKIGEWVLAVGNPFNLMSTVTAGIVSAKGRNINAIENNPSKGLFPIESFIQTDAAVNPGNSGGALVNTKGQLVGINTAIASNTGSYTGYSFAVPVNIVKKVVADIVEFGEVQRAFIGVSIRDLDSKLAQEKNINEIKGIYVQSTLEDGAAQEAGIKEGDVIVKIGEATVNNSSELQEQVSKFRPGDKMTVVVERENKEKVFALTLKNKNGDTGIIKKEKTAEVFSALGASFQNISDEERKKLKINNGVKISKLTHGKLRDTGLNEGFIITSIDKKRIGSVDDLKSALENKKGGVLIEGIYPNGIPAYYAFGI